MTIESFTTSLISYSIIAAIGYVIGITFESLLQYHYDTVLQYFTNTDGGVDDRISIPRKRDLGIPYI
jgi:hypothetical protein